MKAGGPLRYLEINGDLVRNDSKEKKSVANNTGRMGRVICTKLIRDRITSWITEKTYS